MSTLVFVDPKISTQVDRAQSSRASVPLPEDPYEAIRQAYLVGTDTESEPFEEGSGTSGARSTSSDSTAPLSSDHPLTYTTPVLVPFHRRTARMVVRVPPAMSPSLFPSIAEVEAMSDSVFWDEGLTVKDEGFGMGVESPSLGGDEAAPWGQQRAAPVVKTAVGEPSGLEYRALRRREIASREGQMPSVFEVGQGSGSIPEPERPDGVSALRQPTLTTWIDPEDGITYIDIPAYPPPAPLIQTLPSPEWSSGSFPISPAPSIILSPISSPMISLIVPSLVASPATAEAEGFLTESGAITDEIFSQRYQFRSLEHEHERTAMTFRALWRPMLALEAWTGRRFAARAIGDERSCYCFEAGEGL
nr:hypothetical protein [Tanacetum cinerariifolium]